LLTGTGEVPLLVGKVYVEPTRLYLPAGRMNLQAGMIRFEQTEPDRPKLDLLGTATM
jgi:translocation and assembly module TamB